MLMLQPQLLLQHLHYFSCLAYKLLQVLTVAVAAVAVAAAAAAAKKMMVVVYLVV